MPWRCVTDGVRKEKERLTAAIGRILMMNPKKGQLAKEKETNS